MNIETELKNVEQTLWRIEDVCPYGSEVDLAVRDAIRAVRNAITTEHEYRTGIKSSKKPIKSFRDASTEDTSNDYGFHWDGDNIYDKDGFHWYFGDYINNNDDPGIGPYSSYMQAVKETEDSIRDSFTEDEIPDPEDYAYQLVDFAVETLPDPGKFIKEYEGFVKSSRKSIKSSLEDRLIPYLEEFEEGYANAITRDSEEASEFEHVYEDTFFEQFKSDYNLTDEDIQKLDRAVREIWDASSTEEGEVRDMGEMYGAPRGATPEEALKHFE